MEKLYKLHFELLPQPPYASNLAPSDYLLFVELKRTLQGKKFGSSEEMISETEAYFEAKDKSNNKKMYRVVREAFQSVYSPRRRLRLWIKS